MKTLPGKPLYRPLRPVDCVAQKGMANVGHMHPDLVGAAGLQSALDMGIALIPAQNAPVSHGPAAGGIDSHFLPVCFMPGNGSVHCAGIFPKPAHGNRLVGAGQGVILQLSGESQVGGVIFGGNDEPAGVSVDAVDNAGAKLAVDAGEGVSAERYILTIEMQEKVQ